VSVSEALEPLYQQLRARQMIVHQGSAPLNDYNYSLTDTGRDRAAIARQACWACTSAVNGLRAECGSADDSGGVSET